MQPYWLIINLCDIHSATVYTDKMQARISSVALKPILGLVIFEFRLNVSRSLYWTVLVCEIRFIRRMQHIPFRYCFRF